MRIFVRSLAVVLAYGALVHVANVLDLAGARWFEEPQLWRVMDVLLLVFDVVVGMALWRTRPWGVVAFVTGVVLLQMLPYTLFPEAFSRTPEQRQALGGLVLTWLVLVATLVSLVLARGKGDSP